jgi:ubiquinone/menaquinone biosynthesis C-methylase UbiE
MMGFYPEYIVPHLVNLAMRNRQLAPYRKRTIRLAQGRVLEFGVGSGMNLPLYTDRAKEILGLDPHPKLLAIASQKPRSIPSKLIEGSAKSIPLDDASRYGCINLEPLLDTRCGCGPCRDSRVVKPDGQLLFVEHGLAPENSVQNWQNRLTPLCKRIAGRCHLNRPISSLIEDEGFHIAQVQAGYMPGPKPMTLMYEGSARPA